MDLCQIGEHTICCGEELRWILQISPMKNQISGDNDMRISLKWEICDIISVFFRSYPNALSKEERFFPVGLLGQNAQLLKLY